MPDASGSVARHLTGSLGVAPVNCNCQLDYIDNLLKWLQRIGKVVLFRLEKFQVNVKGREMNMLVHTYLNLLTQYDKTQLTMYQ